jgi:eukaryotic-like serine/threonine-protein kinase
MEHLEGETLAKRLEKGALPLDQALRHAMEIGDALDKAHRRGIVHRDLKPGNIMITKAGAKLLDFGLAKLRLALATAPVAGASTIPPAGPPLTEEGTLLGTLQYMAPEQLEAKEADARTDIFAFGAIVFEMVTGKKAFEAKSHASLVAAILEHEPPAMTNLEPLTPRFLDHTVRRCLAKDPEERWQSAADLVRELRWQIESMSVAGADPRPARGVAGYERLGWTVALVLVALLAAFGTARWMIAGSPAPDAVVHATIPLTPGEPLGLGANLALSPDGRHLVYDPGHWTSGGQRLYVRQLDHPNPVAVRGTEGGCCPFFSPDGDLGFVSRDSKLQTVALGGGTPATITDVTPESRGAAWGPDGTIVFAPAVSDGLWQVPATGGEARPLTTRRSDKRERTHRWPTMLPDGRSVLFMVGTADITSFDEARIEVVSLDTGERRTLIEGGMHGLYSPPGHLIYARSGTILTVPFDPKRLEVTGRPVEVVRDVFIDPLNGYANVALSRAGLLVYAPGGDMSRYYGATLFWVDRKGRATPASAIRRPYERGRISPDGSRLALAITEANVEIWVLDLARDTLMRLAYGWSNNFPVWTKDGKALIFSSNRDGADRIYRQVADGNRPAEPLVTTSGMSDAAWSPDGRTLVFAARRAESGSDILIVRPDDGRSPQPLLQGRHNERQPEVSPDGRWLAYTSDESGRDEVYVQPFPALGPKWPLSSGGGLQPRWTRKGRELVYRNGRQLLSVEIATSAVFQPGKPRLLFEGEFERGDWFGGDVTPDGERFLMMRGVEPPEIAELTVVFTGMKS